MAIVQAGAIVEEGAVLGDDVIVGYNAVILSGSHPQKITKIANGSVIGPNATILPGVVIGARAVISAGALVEKNVPPNAIISGNPGTITGYVSALLHSPENFYVEPIASKISKVKLDVGECYLHELPLVPDIRGSLSVAEFGEHVPFSIKRCFWVFDVPSREVRGEHAHKKLHQYLICVKGSVSVVVDDGINKAEVALNKPNLGLYIPPRVWGIQYKYSKDAVLLVLASAAYSADDYLRDYSEFISYINSEAA